MVTDAGFSGLNRSSPPSSPRASTGVVANPRSWPQTRGTASSGFATGWWPRGIKQVILHKDNEQARHDPAVRFDRQAYRNRCVVEHCVGWLKENRRIGTRFEKLAVNFLAMLQLAIIKRYLKLLF